MQLVKLGILIVKTWKNIQYVYKYVLYIILRKTGQSYLKQNVWSPYSKPIMINLLFLLYKVENSKSTSTNFDYDESTILEKLSAK